ncbi:hypothetical protein [Nocardioides sp. P5_E3]
MARPTTPVLLAIASTLLLALAVVSSTPAGAVAAQPKYVAPIFVGAVGATCEDLGDETYNVTVRFKVTGGRYNNLGEPATSSAIINAAVNGNGRYDNVRKGGTRYVTAGIHFLYKPSATEQTATFKYQHHVAPITKPGMFPQRDRILKRNVEVTFSCPNL